jgi:hypothetical protein
MTHLDNIVMAVPIPPVPKQAKHSIRPKRITTYPPCPCGKRLHFYIGPILCHMDS